MNLPFDSPQFFAVFARYNLAVWPAQVVLNGLAIALVMVVLRAWSDRAVSGVLALWGLPAESSALSSRRGRGE